MNPVRRSVTAGRRVVSITVTEQGRRLAERLPFEHRAGDPQAALEECWATADGVVAFIALGALVRLVAPLLGGKHSDPALVCVDDAGRWVVPVLGGHAAGANALAEEVAALLGAEAVVTTATDVRGMLALDTLEGFTAEGELAAVGRAMLDGARVALDNELGWALPRALREALRADAAPAAPAARIVVTDRAELGPGPPAVALRPPSLVVGVGCASDAEPAALEDLLDAALCEAALAKAAVGTVATIDRRVLHPAPTALARRLGTRLVGFSPSLLDAVPVPHPSGSVRRHVGTASVAEAAALIAAGPGAELVVAKRVGGAATLALARRAAPAGVVRAVGLGPGGPEHRSPAATRAIAAADRVLGYEGYLRRLDDLGEAQARAEGFALGEEQARVRAALELAAAGMEVALVSSGDPGLYAMAAPLLEEATALGAPVSVQVVPGTTAAQAAAARLGAPLSADHAIVSLSDLHVPWSSIEARLRALAATDLPIALYNPRSSRRTWQLARAREILLAVRPATTPVGIVRRATAPDESVVLCTLGELDPELVDMSCCVVVGGPATTRHGTLLVTPRIARASAEGATRSPLQHEPRVDAR
jgi:cobalt-precorrin 5A hydrolase/precorrin-3B C17-methyltransferase